MKVVLAPKYLFLMRALALTMLDVRTAPLWARTLKWPHRVDTEGATSRYRRKIPWVSVGKISRLDSGLKRGDRDGTIPAYIAS
jgi:hypothetical protein